MSGGIKSVSIIGNGNLATQLGKALFDHGLNIDLVAGRTLENARLLANQLNAQCASLDSEPIFHSDLVLLALSDDAIEKVSSAIQPVKGILAHCSGIKHPEAIHEQHPNRACFYPLQTFTPGDVIDWKEVPFLIQADQDSSGKSLAELAGHLSTNVTQIDAHQKEVLHLAAVFVNNYSNALYAEANAMLGDVGLTFQLLMPLIKKTVVKLDKLSPVEAQTGPARRGDQKTMEKHLSLMKDDELKTLYKLLANRIQKK